MDTAVLMPVKAFSEAKQRLAGALTAEERVRLATWMATRVAAAACDTPLFVVCDSDEVRLWAATCAGDVRVLWTAQLGLNGAVDDGVAAIARAGFNHVTVTHADLPLPGNLLDVAREGTTTLVPDRRRDGTNVMSFPIAAPITAQYGQGSFDRHWDSAADGKRELRIDAQLSIDVDTPSDLTHPLLSEVLPSWLPTIPVNHFTHRAPVSTQ